jgi:putative DNA primase/helicase
VTEDPMPPDDAPVADMPGRPTIDPPELVRGDHVELADRLLERLSDGGEGVVADDGALWRYGDETGLWRAVPDDEQSRIIQGFAGAAVPGAKPGSFTPLKIRVGDVRGARALAADRAMARGFFAAAPAGLGFENGFLRIGPKGPQLHPHAPENRASVAMPFAYDPCSPYPMWLAFLEGVFRDDPDRDLKIRLLQEFMGACLLGIAPRFQLCVVLTGGGENGKSAFIDVVRHQFPKEARCAIPPQKWGEDYFKAQLAGKRFNCVSELPESEIIASEAFKAIVTGDETTGRHPHERPFSFVPRAGNVFACNALPGTTDHTKGFWRRFAVVAFNRSFANDPTRDNQIAQRIIAAESPGVVGWMLEGAANLLARGNFEIPPSSDEAKAAWRRESDQVAIFLGDCTRALVPEEQLLPAAVQGTPAKALYASYREWGKENGHPPVSSTSFGKRLKLLGFERRHTEHGERYQLALMADAPARRERGEPWWSRPN